MFSQFGYGRLDDVLREMEEEKAQKIAHLVVLNNEMIDLNRALPERNEALIKFFIVTQMNNM